MIADFLLFNVFDTIFFRPIMRQNVCISLNRDVLDNIDSERGDTPRSRVIESLITKGIESENIASCSQHPIKEKEEGSARDPLATNTVVPAPLSSARDEVDE